MVQLMSMEIVVTTVTITVIAVIVTTVVTTTAARKTSMNHLLDLFWLHMYQHRHHCLQARHFQIQQLAVQRKTSQVNQQVLLAVFRVHLWPQMAPLLLSLTS